jgi:hypothetical protein
MPGYRLRVLAAALLALTAAGCASTAGNQPPAAAPVASASSTGGPSAAARMVCGAEAGADLARALGVRPVQPPAASWADQLYTCRYGYPSGVLVLSVKDLPDAAGTDAYFGSARKALSPALSLPGLGEDAFSGPDGSVYVRKDFKVLHVDVAGLPAQFGQPPHARANVAFTVANVILNCWTEG